MRAAVRVVLPWSTWPIVPMLTWGFFLSNFPRAARTVKERRGEWGAEGVESEYEGRKEEERLSLTEVEMAGEREGEGEGEE